MKNIFILLFGVLLIHTTSAQSKVETSVRQHTEEMTQVLQLTAAEKTQVYDILLEKELKTVTLRKKYKSDPDTKKAAIKKINPLYNRQLKNVIGKERMVRYNAHKKSKRKQQ